MQENYTQFKGWQATKLKLVMVTVKPIVSTQGFLEQVSYRKAWNFVLVSTAALKPTNYKTSRSAKNQFLRRVITVIKLQRAQSKPQIKNLETLDKLWRK